MMNVGESAAVSRNGLSASVGFGFRGKTCYVLEGNITCSADTLCWLRDEVAMIPDIGSVETIAASVPSTDGVYLVPAFSGLGAPYFDGHARAAITGMNRGTTRAHIVRAALESMAHQCHDLKTAFAADGADWNLLRIDGGMSGNNWLAQDLADVLAVPLERPTDVETTARGAAMLAAVGAGLYPSLAAAKAMLPPVDRFSPAMDAATRDARLSAWQGALAATLGNTG